ncbi:MAG: hypothetical protein ACFCD0_16710 [Gemmataceae bacterium]
MKLPKFHVGEYVSVILNERNRTPHQGRIREVIWHYKDQQFNYYLVPQGRKGSKRYFAEDLKRVVE